MTNTTLDYTIRNGFEIGTEDYGIANLQMVLSFAKETFVNTLYLVAKAKQIGECDTNLVSIRDLARVTFSDLKKLDEEVAAIWNESWKHIACSEMFIDDLLSSFKNIISVDVEDAKESGDYADILFSLNIDAFAIAVKMHAATN